MASPSKAGAEPRIRLNRDRVLRTAIGLADANGAGCAHDAQAR